MILLLLPSFIIFIAVWIATLSKDKKHRVIATAVLLTAMSFQIAVLGSFASLIYACEADLAYGGKCVLRAVPVYQLGE